MIRPTTSPAGRAAVLLDYVLRPAGFIGHCNVRSSLNLAGEFMTSKKHRLSLKDLPISGGPGMNPSHHGSDEQVFGAKQQARGTNISV